MHMNKRKIIIAIVALLAVIGIVSYLTQGSELFKGQVLNQAGQTQDQNGETANITQPEGLPDLEAVLEVLPAAIGSQDIIAEIKYKNLGTAPIDSKVANLSYVLTINGQEVLNNQDTYTTIQPGDEFSYQYPISREIYQYENTGKVEFSIDPQNLIKESNEGNNLAVKEYSF